MNICHRVFCARPVVLLETHAREMYARTAEARTLALVDRWIARASRG